MIRAWTASLMLHLLLVGMLLSMGQNLTRPRPLAIEVELVSAPTRKAPAADTASRPEPPIQAPKKQAVKPDPAPMLTPAKIPATRPVLPPPAPAPVLKPPPEPPALPEPPQTPRGTTALTTAQEPASPTAAKLATASTTAGPPAAAGTPTAGAKELPGPEAAAASYLGTQFSNIRDRVMASLHYPPMARRQGWRGVVRLEFTILTNGDVENLRVLQSSGYPLLDRQALRAVEAAAPFSPPPAAATITLPVRFRLE